MRACGSDTLSQATLQALRAAAGASVVAEARTWLPQPPRWRLMLHQLWTTVRLAAWCRCC